MDPRSDQYKEERTTSVSFRLLKSLEAEGVFPTRGLVLREVLDTIGGEDKLICFQRLSSTHYEVTFKPSHVDARNNFLHAGFLLQATSISVFECDPKFTTIKVKNLPAEVPDKHLIALLSTYGTVSSSKHVLDDEGIWTGDRLVDMVIKADIPSMIRLGKYPIVIRYRGQKLCCHHCDRWGHPIAECPYKIHNLCIRCAKAGHSARFCSQPWVLDNSPVEYADLPYEPTPSDMQLSTPEQFSSPTEETSQECSPSTAVSSTPLSSGKRPEEAAKPKKKKNKKSKENPEAFQQEDFNIDSLPFMQPTASPLTDLATKNPFSALEVEDQDMVHETPPENLSPTVQTAHVYSTESYTAADEEAPPTQVLYTQSQQTPDTLQKETSSSPPSSYPSTVTSVIPPTDQVSSIAKHSMVASLARRLSRAYLPQISQNIAPVRKPTKPSRMSFKPKRK